MTKQFLFKALVVNATMTTTIDKTLTPDMKPWLLQAIVRQYIRISENVNAEIKRAIIKEKE